MILLSTAYFPNIQYFSKLANNAEISIENDENYAKKTYRNRCEILAANGKLSLTVPIVKTQEKINIKNVVVDYSEDWQKNHLKAIEAAYGLSPFYEFYIDDLKPIFEKHYKYLFDLNNEVLKQVLEIIGIKNYLKFTEEFTKPIETNKLDFRFSIHPKKKLQAEDNNFLANKYIQTFSEKFDFIPNLSILDLIFNLGPECLEYLHKTKN